MSKRVSKLLLLLALVMVWGPVWAGTPPEAELRAAARQRYPGTKHVQGMAWYRMVPFRGGYLADTRDGSGTFENNREGGSLWRYERGRWTLLSHNAKVLLADSPAWHTLGLSSRQAIALTDHSPELPLRKTRWGEYQEPTGVVVSFKQACLQRFPGCSMPYVEYVQVVPYRNTAFGITVGSREGFYAPLWAVWEQKDGNWSFIFDFDYWPVGYSHYTVASKARRQAENAELDGLFAQYGFSHAMRGKLVDGILTQMAP